MLRPSPARTLSATTSPVHHTKHCYTRVLVLTCRCRRSSAKLKQTQIQRTKLPGSWMPSSTSRRRTVPGCVRSAGLGSCTSAAATMPARSPQLRPVKQLLTRICAFPTRCATRRPCASISGGGRPAADCTPASLARTVGLTRNVLAHDSPAGGSASWTTSNVCTITGWPRPASLCAAGAALSLSSARGIAPTIRVLPHASRYARLLRSFTQCFTAGIVAHESSKGVHLCSARQQGSG